MNNFRKSLSAGFIIFVCLLTMTIVLTSIPARATGPATIPTGPTAASGLTGPSSSQTAAPTNPDQLPAQGTTNTGTTERNKTTGSTSTSKQSTYRP